MRLKHKLHIERVILVRWGVAPLCPVCEKPVLDGGDLHENIITKRNIQGAPLEIQALIYVRENCAIVHTGECHIKAQGPARQKVTTYLINHEGEEKVLQWLESVNKKVHTPFTLQVTYCILLETYKETHE